MTLLAFILMLVLALLSALLIVSFILIITREWSYVKTKGQRNLILCILGIVLVITLIIIEEDPFGKELLENGDRKEVAILSISNTIIVPRGMGTGC